MSPRDAQAPMRVLIVHNRYQQRGGEDTVCETEARQLSDAGIQVDTMLVSNDIIQSKWEAASVALRPGGMPAIHQALEERLDQTRPDLVHFHNGFPLIGAGGLRVVLARRIPTVLTLHNYRLLCAAAMLMRDGAPCELCVTQNRLHGIRHRCYRGSVAGTTAVTAHAGSMRRMIMRHAADLRCIALTRFARDQFIAGGLPPQCLVLKPNSVDDRGRPPREAVRRGILYVGRLSAEKGVVTLVEAANATGIELTLVGDGPLAAALQRIAGPSVRMAGRLSPDETRAAMRRALAVAIPSTWFEGFPMTAVEAMEAGCMLLASDIGSLSEIVTPDIGMLVPPGNVPAWAVALNAALARPDLQAKGRAAREYFETNFSPKANVSALTTIYQDALAGTMLQTADAH